VVGEFLSQLLVGGEVEFLSLYLMGEEVEFLSQYSLFGLVLLEVVELLNQL
jgi:hypothetical protein